jgi:hypothetical protein
VGQAYLTGIEVMTVEFVRRIRSGRGDVDLETRRQLGDGDLVPCGHVAAGRRRRGQERKHEHPFCSGLSDTSGLTLCRS